MAGQVTGPSSFRCEGWGAVSSVCQVVMKLASFTEALWECAGNGSLFEKRGAGARI